MKTGNWLNHLEYDRESPAWRHFFRGLAKDYTLIRYDARGNGMSEWDVDELSMEVRDLETVVDAAGPKSIPAPWHTTRLRSRKSSRMLGTATSVGVHTTQ